MFKIPTNTILPLFQLDHLSSINPEDKNSILASINSNLRWKEILTLMGYICGTGFLILTVIMWISLVRGKSRINEDELCRVQRKIDKSKKL